MGWVTASGFNNKFVQIEFNCVLCFACSWFNSGLKPIESEFGLIVLPSLLFIYDWLATGTNLRELADYPCFFIRWWIQRWVQTNWEWVRFYWLAHYPCFVTSCPRCDDSSFVGLRSLATCSWCTAMPCSKRMNLWNSIRIIFFQFLPRHYMVILVEKLESWKESLESGLLDKCLLPWWSFSIWSQSESS